LFCRPVRRQKIVRCVCPYQRCVAGGRSRIDCVMRDGRRRQKCLKRSLRVDTHIVAGLGFGGSVSREQSASSPVYAFGAQKNTIRCASGGFSRRRCERTRVCIETASIGTPRVCLLFFSQESLECARAVLGWCRSLNYIVLAPLLAECSNSRAALVSGH